MPRGGHANSGPPPDPEALRRTRGTDAAWHVLPVTGRPGPPPEWPLEQFTDREAALWVKLWAKPQATRWEALGQELEVALYVRRRVEAEEPGATAALGNHVLRLAEGLGLTIPGLLRNRWQIGSQQSAPTAAATGTDGPAPASAPATSSRSRILRSVPTDGA